MGRLHADWGELWPEVAQGTAAFLAALEARSPTTELAQRVKEILQARADAITSERSPQTVVKSVADGEEPNEHHRHVAELEQAKAWLEQQVVNWKGAVAERDQQILALKAWIDELEAGKTWLVMQRQNWMRLADEREQQLRRSIPLAWPRWLRPGLWRGLPTSTPPAQPVDAPIPERPTAITNPEPAAMATSEQEAAARPEAAPWSSPFASPRHVAPLSREWGYDRGLPVDRYYIEGFLVRYEADVRGRVLEVGDNSYTKRFGGDRVSQSDVLNVAAGHPQTTFVADLAEANEVPSEAFDCVILTQTLQLIYDVRGALRTLERILKPGGVLLLTCPGLTRTSQTEWRGSWYWRFTPAMLSRILGEAVPGLQVDVQSHGNALAASAFLFGLAAEELSPAELDYDDADYDVILTVRGVKRRSDLQTVDQRGTTEIQDKGISPTLQSTTQYHKASAEPTPASGLVLLYHRVALADVDPWSIAVTPASFSEQLSVLQRTFQPVRLGELARALEQPTSGRPPVAVTFDDGYADNLHAALPLLEQNGVPATFFITTSCITQHAEFWWDTLERLWLWPGTLPAVLRLTVGGRSHEWQLGEWIDYSEDARDSYRHWRAWQAPPTPRHAAFTALWELLHHLHPETLRPLIAQMQVWSGLAAEPRQRTLNLDELLCLARSEVADFGAHTVTHPSLAALPLHEQQIEIEKSKRWLTEAVGRPVWNFSYPFGRLVDYGPDTVALARAAGFERACTNTAGAVQLGTDPYQLPRLHVQDWDGETFERELWRLLGR
jgi:peptidoglycan/xylan/chitin deacetylase (PgdA/CDA1 family)/SAM-dependent methyltransferase